MRAVFTDAEIDAALTSQGSVEGACYELASFQYSHALRHTAAKSKSGNGQSMSVDNTHTLEGWKALMDHFQRFAKSASRMPTISVGVNLTPSSDGWTG